MVKKLCMTCKKRTEQEYVGQEVDGKVYKCKECGNLYVELK